MQTIEEAIEELDRRIAETSTAIDRAVEDLAANPESRSARLYLESLQKRRRNLVIDLASYTVGPHREEPVRVLPEAEYPIGRKELAKRMGVSEPTINRMVTRGNLPAPCIPGATARWMWSYVQEFLDDRHRNPPGRVIDTSRGPVAVALPKYDVRSAAIDALQGHPRRGS